MLPFMPSSSANAADSMPHMALWTRVIQRVLPHCNDGATHGRARQKNRFGFCVPCRHVVKRADVEKRTVSDRCSPRSSIRGALHKKSWAVIDRPYSLGCATVGALYERPRCIFCAKPIRGQGVSLARGNRTVKDPSHPM